MLGLRPAESTRSRSWALQFPAEAPGKIAAAAPALLRIALVAASAAAIAAYCYVAVRRMGYPFDLEWIEDTAVVQVHRILHGQSLYVPPSVNFVPDGYPPVYFYLCAPLAAVMGVSYLPLRLVSFAASLASMWFAYRIVARETGYQVAGIAAAGVFAATFAASGWWFDLARVDSLFVALCLASVYLARVASTPRSGAVAGTVMALSFLTKQTALPIGICVAVGMIHRRDGRRAGYGFAAAFAGLLAASTLALGLVSHGWYVFYVFAVLPHQQVVHGEWFGFWVTDVVSQFWPVILLGACVMTALLWRQRRDTDPHAHREVRFPFGFYGWTSTGLLTGAWASRVHSGGFDNVLMPMFAALAIAAGLSLGVALRGSDTRGVAAAGGWSARKALPPWSVGPAALASAAIVAQIALLAWGQPYGGQIPTRVDSVEGRAYIAFLHSVKGPVYEPSNPYYELLAGKSPTAHQGAVSDVLRSAGETAAIDRLSGSIRSAVEHERFALVIEDNDFDDIALPADFERYYRACPTYLFESVPLPDFATFIDLYVRPNRMFVPVHVRTCPELPDFAGIARRNRS